jgi:hypothetical protein
MFPMMERPMSTRNAKSPRGEATSEDGKRREAEPRAETRRRIRQIVERHRETLDYRAER